MLSSLRHTERGLRVRLKLVRDYKHSRELWEALDWEEASVYSQAF